MPAKPAVNSAANPDADCIRECIMAVAAGCGYNNTAQ